MTYMITFYYARMGETHFLTMPTYNLQKLIKFVSKTKLHVSLSQSNMKHMYMIIASTESPESDSDLFSV